VRLIQTETSNTGRLADTAHLMARGELSLTQAHEIARTETQAPGSETSMIDLARQDGMRRLRDEGRRRRLERRDRDDLHRRQHQARHLRHWTDEAGMTCFQAALPPEWGVPLINRLEHLTDQIWRHHRRTEGPDGLERRDAYMADALLELVGSGSRGGAGAGSTSGDRQERIGEGPADTRAGSGSEGQQERPSSEGTPGAGRAGRRRARSPRQTELVLVWDLIAYIRGHLLPGEIGHILGGGPIPDHLMRQLSEDAFYKTVTHDGVRIDTIAHHGRHIPAELRTALTIGSPPTFAGNPCRCGCGRTQGLDIDHLHPLDAGGLTHIDNLSPTCRPSHVLKTERDRAAGLHNPRNRAGP
jgi:hypothetical protein